MKEDGFIATFLYEPRSSDIMDHRGEQMQACVEIGAEEPQIMGGSASVFARCKGGGKGKTSQEWMETPEVERAVRFIEANGETNGPQYQQNGNLPQAATAPEPFTGRSQQLTAMDSDDQEINESHQYTMEKEVTAGYRGIL